MLKVTEEMTTSLLEEMVRDFSLEEMFRQCDRIDLENPSYFRLLDYLARLDMNLVNNTTLVSLGVLIYRLFQKSYEIEQMENEC